MSDKSIRLFFLQLQLLLVTTTCGRDRARGFKKE